MEHQLNQILFQIAKNIQNQMDLFVVLQLLDQNNYSIPKNLNFPTKFEPSIQHQNQLVSLFSLNHFLKPHTTEHRDVSLQAEAPLRKNTQQLTITSKTTQILFKQQKEKNQFFIEQNQNQNMNMNNTIIFKENQIKQRIKKQFRSFDKSKKSQKNLKKIKLIQQQPESVYSLFKDKPQKASDSKNIIKNFTRAFLTYTHKERNFSDRVLKKLEIDSQEFYQYVWDNRQKIQSISSLRSMWIEEGNKFAKAMRIISFEYLRKRHLDHTFNSKIRNIKRNIKYWHKLMQSVSKPQKFTIIKEF